MNKVIAIVGIACENADGRAIYNVDRFEIQKDIMFVADDIINHHYKRTGTDVFDLRIYYVDQNEKHQTYLENVNLLQEKREE